MEPSSRLDNLPRSDPGDGGFYLDNMNFEGGDAELWFHVIRHARTARIVEIGSGHSTRMARLAIESLRGEDASYTCDHLCIEPYEMPWRERTGARVLRQKVEDADRAPFKALEANDILFIDSSHMIRPGGDVLVEFLDILPRLAPGVIVHVHDIFHAARLSRQLAHAPAILERAISAGGIPHAQRRLGGHARGEPDEARAL